MYKLKSPLAIIAVFGILLAGSAYGQASYAPLTVVNQNVYTADYLLGHQVYGSGNQPLGSITDFVVDRSNGRIALLVLSDVPCLGNARVAVPFGFLFKDQGGALKLNFPEGAPIAPPDTTGADAFPCQYREVMERGVMSGTIDSAWVEDLYTHYGYAPYWTEHGGTTMALYSCGDGRLVGSDVRIRGTETKMYEKSSIDRTATVSVCPPDVARSDDQLRLDARDDRMREDAYMGETHGMAYVKDAVIEHDGRISYLILSDVQGRENEYVAVPFSLVRGDADVCALDISRDQLAAAPPFDYHVHLGDRIYAGKVYSYYGVHPYWTEEGMVR